MSRPDQSITFLRSFGYSVFRLPRPAASPLEVLERNGKDLSRMGTLAQLVDPGSMPLPAISRDDRPGIDIEGKETSKINVNIGVSILGSFIGALGGNNLGLQVGFNRAKTVSFKYTEIMEDSVDVLELEKFVKAGSISPFIPKGTLDKLIDDDIYVITSILKTKKILVNAQGDAGSSVALDVPVIKGAVGGNLKVDSAGGLTSSVAFEGAFPVAFGLQAVQLVFDKNNEFLTTQQLPAGDAAARAVATAARSTQPGPVFLEPRGALVRVGE